MNNFKKVIFSGVLIGGLLAGCGAEDMPATSEPKEEAKPSEQKPLKQQAKKDENGKYLLENVGDTAKTKAGTGELLKIKKVNETIDIAPLKVTVKDIKVIKMSDVSNEFAVDMSMMTQIDSEVLEKGFSYIQVQFTAENTTDGNVEWYDLMNIVTDKGEQIDGQMKDFLADDAEMDSQFIGKVKKEYQDGFIVKDDQIGKVKLVFGNTMNGDTYEDITDKQTVEYTLE